ncbi:hypothetical protein BLNAU_17537 [Blattamonas nauphoetae]|uniref:Uncharacterized protein n=1 Tax=Blattamonas nauphoetae TaxID=2049346 RepID=A0ABQ9X9Z2_9EUKA|nr:hypothetical protein BLNAU_17537 [Blattamonas nauphoetae]
MVPHKTVIQELLPSHKRAERATCGSLSVETYDSRGARFKFRSMTHTEWESPSLQGRDDAKPKSEDEAHIHHFFISLCRTVLESLNLATEHDRLLVIVDWLIDKLEIHPNRDPKQAAFIKELIRELVFIAWKGLRRKEGAEAGNTRALYALAKNYKPRPPALQSDILRLSESIQIAHLTGLTPSSRQSEQPAVEDATLKTQLASLKTHFAEPDLVEEATRQDVRDEVEKISEYEGLNSTNMRSRLFNGLIDMLGSTPPFYDANQHTLQYLFVVSKSEVQRKDTAIRDALDRLLTETSKKPSREAQLQFIVDALLQCLLDTLSDTITPRPTYSNPVVKRRMARIACDLLSTIVDPKHDDAKKRLEAVTLEIESVRDRLSFVLLTDVFFDHRDHLLSVHNYETTLVEDDDEEEENDENAADYVNDLTVFSTHFGAQQSLRSLQLPRTLQMNPESQDRLERMSIALFARNLLCFLKMDEGLPFDNDCYVKQFFIEFLPELNPVDVVHRSFVDFMNETRLLSQERFGLGPEDIATVLPKPSVSPIPQPFECLKERQPSERRAGVVRNKHDPFFALTTPKVGVHLLLWASTDLLWKAACRAASQISEDQKTASCLNVARASIFGPAPLEDLLRQLDERNANDLRDRLIRRTMQELHRIGVDPDDLGVSDDDRKEAFSSFLLCSAISCRRNELLCHTALSTPSAGDVEFVDLVESIVGTEESETI